jgi:hypothetical protein
MRRSGARCSNARELKSVLQNWSSFSISKRSQVKAQDAVKSYMSVKSINAWIFAVTFPSAVACGLTHAGDVPDAYRLKPTAEEKAIAEKQQNQNEALLVQLAAQIQENMKNMTPEQREKLEALQKSLRNGTGLKELRSQNNDYKNLSPDDRKKIEDEERDVAIQQKKLDELEAKMKTMNRPSVKPESP